MVGWPLADMRDIPVCDFLAADDENVVDDDAKNKTKHNLVRRGVVGSSHNNVYKVSEFSW